MRVLVLAGGISDERAVSLRSGRAIADALRAAGHEVIEGDAGPDKFAALEQAFDVVFPAFHGEFGEDGTLQAELERRGVPFVGSGSGASRLAFDKLAAKAAWRAAGLPTPDWGADVKPPCVVKPVGGGSSLGVRLCATADERAAAVAAGGGPVMIEQWVKGPEWTVGIVGDEVLPPIRIGVAGDEWFDYHRKYADDGAPHLFDLQAPAALVDEVKHLCLSAHRILGCRHLSRVDVMLDADARPWLLELNTLPGFTDRSLLPDAARAAGLSFPQLVDRLVRLATA
jgi:D-alanine-D-alanine ligase